MKNTFFYSSMLMTALLFMTVSCSNSDDDNSSNPNNNAEVIIEIENNVETGTWFVSSYVDDGEDETSDFNGYTFTFATDGTLTATNGTTALVGSWDVSDSSNSNDDSSSDDIDFNIFFSVSDSSDFDDLVDDWDVVTYSSTTLSLRDVSGGDGSVDTLVFTRL